MRIFSLIVCICILIPSVVFANNVQIRQSYVYKLLNDPCTQYNLPKLWVLAITRQESDYHPWMINIQGKDYILRNKDDAVRLAQWALRNARSFDLGLMQINSYWIRKYRLPVEVVLEPKNNVKLGCWIFANEIKRHGLNWKAVAAYHVPLKKNYNRGLLYAHKVANQLQKIKNNQ